MEYSDFLKVILGQKKASEKVHEAYKLGIDLIEFVEIYESIGDILIKEIYGEEGADWYSWFCYENEYGEKGVQAWDENEQPIFYSIESTWEYLEANYKKQND